MRESRLYSFLDNKNGFTLHFFEGQKLMANLSLLKNLQISSFAYYRDIVLSTVPMISFLKPTEGFGLYLDSQSPYFRFKIEANSNGSLRTLLLPESFNQFPDKITGEARFVKNLPGSVPYTSIIKIDNEPTAEIINRILNESYQTNANVQLGNTIDQSLMVVKLPQLNVDKHYDDSTSMKEFLLKNKKFIQYTFDADLNDIEQIVNYFEQNGYAYMASREVRFHCPCSKERMIANLSTLSVTDREDLFDKNGVIEAKCDYCLTVHKILRSDFN
ncbi:MAG: Hsp33 family molecular chaperone HslO [Bacteriovoracaceae bacterium]|nr:Hsp33 family molecular chaperone HslO [Bacteriovoracaceae bacterium]